MTDSILGGPEPFKPPETMMEHFQNHYLPLICICLFLVLLWIVLKSKRGASKQENLQDKIAEAKKHLREPAAKPPVFASAEHAQAVFLHANMDYYQYLLEELRCGLREEGYEITDDRKRRIRLPGDIERQVAKRVFLARERFITPYLSASQLDEKGKESLSNGNSVQWMHWLIAGNESQGWFIASRDAPDE